MAKTILVRSGLQKIGFTKNAETGIMQQRWVGHPVKYSTLTMDQLCQNIAESLGIPRSTIRAGVIAISKQIRQLQSCKAAKLQRIFCFLTLTGDL